MSESAHRCTYVIVASLPGHRRPVSRPRPGYRQRPGRHRLGTPGTHPRYPTGSSRPWRIRRARHRDTRTSAAATARYLSLMMLLCTMLVSGWFTATGAAAFAQMIQP